MSEYPCDFEYVGHGICGQPDSAHRDYRLRHSFRGLGARGNSAFAQSRLERGRALTEREIDVFIADWQTPLRHATAPPEIEALELLRDLLRAARSSSKVETT